MKLIIILIIGIFQTSCLSIFMQPSPDEMKIINTENRDCIYLLEKITDGVHAQSVRELSEHEILHLNDLLPKIHREELPKNMLNAPSLPSIFYSVKKSCPANPKEDAYLINFMDNGELTFGSKIDASHKQDLRKFVREVLY